MFTLTYVNSLKDKVISLGHVSGHQQLSRPFVDEIEKFIFSGNLTTDDKSNVLYGRLLVLYVYSLYLSGSYNGLMLAIEKLRMAAISSKRIPKKYHKVVDESIPYVFLGLLSGVNPILRFAPLLERILIDADIQRMDIIGHQAIISLLARLFIKTGYEYVDRILMLDNYATIKCQAQTMIENLHLLKSDPCKLGETRIEQLKQPFMEFMVPVRMLPLACQYVSDVKSGFRSTSKLPINFDFVDHVSFDIMKEKKAIVVVAADLKYFNKFAELFAQTTDELSREICIHIHIISNEIDDTTRLCISKIKTACTRNYVTFSMEKSEYPSRPALYTLRRFSIASWLAHEVNIPLWVTDIDVCCCKDIGDCIDDMTEKRFDIGVRDRGDKSMIWDRYSCQNILFNGGSSARDFLWRIGEIIERIIRYYKDEKEIVLWYVDQLIFYILINEAQKTVGLTIFPQLPSPYSIHESYSVSNKWSDTYCFEYISGHVKYRKDKIFSVLKRQDEAETISLLCKPNAFHGLGESYISSLSKSIQLSPEIIRAVVEMASPEVLKTLVFLLFNNLPNSNEYDLNIIFYGMLDRVNSFSGVNLLKVLTVLYQSHRYSDVVSVFEQSEILPIDGPNHKNVQLAIKTWKKYFLALAKLSKCTIYTRELECLLSMLPESDLLHKVSYQLSR